MFAKYAVTSVTILLFSCSVMASDMLTKNIEMHNHMMNSANSLHQKHSIPNHQTFSTDDCPGATSRPFGDNGLTSGYTSTHCYKTEFDGGNVQSYFQSKPNGSYSTGFSWTFE